MILTRLVKVKKICRERRQGWGLRDSRGNGNLHLNVKTESTTGCADTLLHSFAPRMKRILWRRDDAAVVL